MELKARRKKQRLEDHQKARVLSDMHARLTAGNMVHHNVYRIGKETLDYVRQQQAAKLRKEAEVISKRYRANLKTYQEGANVVNKEQSKWTSNDYQIMIKYKQLSKDNMPPLPKNLQARKDRWEAVKYFPDPLEPVQPPEYIALQEEPVEPVPIGNRGDSDDDLSVASIAMFQV